MHWNVLRIWYFCSIWSYIIIMDEIKISIFRWIFHSRREIFTCSPDAAGPQPGWGSGAPVPVLATMFSDKWGRNIRFDRNLCLEYVFRVLRCQINRFQPIICDRYSLVGNHIPLVYTYLPTTTTSVTPELLKGVSRLAEPKRSPLLTSQPGGPTV